MKTFKDRNGTTWIIEINVAQFKRVRDLAGVDLAPLGKMLVPGSNGEKTLSALIDDPVKLVDVLYVLCMDQAKRADISDEAFGRSFDGETLERATMAFLEELADFFPEPLRSALGQIVARANAEAERVKRELSAEKIAELLNSVLNTPESSVSNHGA